MKTDEKKGNKSPTEIGKSKLELKKKIIHKTTMWNRCQKTHLEAETVSGTFKVGFNPQFVTHRSNRLVWNVSIPATIP